MTWHSLYKCIAAGHFDIYLRIELPQIYAHVAFAVMPIVAG